MGSILFGAAIRRQPYAGIGLGIDSIGRCIFFGNAERDGF
jgi:hypothetical protein